MGSNPTLSAIFLVPAKRQYYRLLATALLPFLRINREAAWPAFTHDSKELPAGNTRR